MVRNTLSYLDTGLAPGMQYYYRIKALNYSGETTTSIETNVMTLTNGVTIPLGSLALWLKADSGHGSGAVNVWIDQSTNNNSASFSSTYATAAPRWSGFDTNGNSVISFFRTNAFVLPPFLAHGTQAEAFVVLRSFGSPLINQVGLWWMSSASLQALYPASTNSIIDNFGRGSVSALVFGGYTNFSKLHLYNPVCTSNEWSAAFNNGSHVLIDTTNAPNFSTGYSLLGLADNTTHNYFSGEITEIMIFNRALTQPERDIVSANYLNKRYKLW